MGTVQSEEGDGHNEDDLPVKIESEITLEKDSQDYENKGPEIAHPARRRLSGRCRQREKKRRQAREEEALKEPMYLQSTDEDELRLATHPLADPIILGVEELTGCLPPVTKEASAESSCEHLPNKGDF